jgi:hypothetical protein
VRRYDSGGEPLELADVAAVVAQVLGTAVERAPVTQADDNIYAGGSAAYAALLTEAGIDAVPLPQQVLETAVTLTPP